MRINKVAEDFALELDRNWNWFIEAGKFWTWIFSNVYMYYLGTALLHIMDILMSKLNRDTFLSADANKSETRAIKRMNILKQNAVCSNSY